MSQLSLRLQSLSPSATFAMSAKSAELKARGVDVINMSVGEPDFNTPDYVKLAAKAAIDGNITRYSPVPGYMDLRKAICAKLRIENALEYAPEEIVVANGAKQAITDTVMALVNPGDEVIIPAPCWVSYIQMARIAGGEPVVIGAPIEQDFKITPSQLEAAITPKSKLIILCSPSNPTGSIYSADELKALAAVVLRHENLFVLSDEIYEHLNYAGRHASIASVPGMRERTVVVNGVSKAYAMTGWRIGFTAAPLWLSKGINMLQGHYSSGPCSVSQMAALAAWSEDWEDGQSVAAACGGGSADGGLRSADVCSADAGLRPADVCSGDAGLRSADVCSADGGLRSADVCSGDGGGVPRQHTVELMRQAFQRRRDLIVRLAREIPGLEVNVPQGAFYLFPKCSSYFGKTVCDGLNPDSGEWAGKTINDSSDFAMYLLEVAHVATVGGDAFGSAECFRMSYATSDENIVEALSRIKKALALLK